MDTTRTPDLDHVVELLDELDQALTWGDDHAVLEGHTRSIRSALEKAKKS